KKNFELNKLLVEKGANVNSRDDIWYQTPLGSAAGAGDLKSVELFLKAGAKDVDQALMIAAAKNEPKLAQAILKDSKVGQDALDAGLHAATNGFSLSPRTEVQETLKKAGAKPLPKVSDAEKKELGKLQGVYESDGGARMQVGVGDVGLLVNGRPVKRLGPDLYSPLGATGAEVKIERENGKVSKITMRRLTAEYSFYLFKQPEVKPAEIASPSAGRVAAQLNWPSFRGPDGTGVADGQNPPIKWDVKKDEGVRWKTKIPGLGHSCPVVWENRVFITTAISKGLPEATIRIGNYGDVGSVEDVSEHTFQVLCLDRDTGKILWTQTAHVGVPKIKRHLKGSQANCTPAVDGKHVVACFGSEGLYCYDFDGKLLWKRDLSALDSSFDLDKEYEWGFGNSPVIHDGLCILQCDLSRDSFIAAFSLANKGEKVWSTPRDEIPSWSSPVVWKNAVRTEIVTNASQFARGYDPATGAELWRIAKKSEATIPAPVLGKDLAYITSGNRPIQPIIALKPGAKGDVSLKEGETKNDAVAWSRMRGGPYMPTPILYGEYFYTCSNSGIMACYEAKTGKEVYKERAGGSSYTASVTAADGRLYITSEEGDVRVVKAGPKFQLLAVNRRMLIFDTLPVSRSIFTSAPVAPSGE
ncbi:MAG TPA: PQQ-binding-like beta-propeller repeat protein, partial [Planctomycetia bacterium]|nr:PQQ-binding-like beta-propeller repeat protein [Planctomycetia bacterium]